MTVRSRTPRLSRRARAPAPEPRPFTVRVHDREIADEFAWLKADNWRAVLKDPDALPGPIGDVLRAENAYAARSMRPLARLRRALLSELRARVKEEDSEPPLPHGDWLYGERYRTGGQHAIIWRRPREGGEEETLLDGDDLARGHEYFDMGGWRVSPDHRRIAFAADTTGSEFHVIHVRDISTGADLGRIEGAGPSLVWSADGGALFYVALDENARPYRVMRRTFGDPPSLDATIYVERALGWFVDVSGTQDGSLGRIEVSDHETSETWLFDLADPEAALRLVLAREQGHEYDVERRGAELVIRTNRDGADDFRIVAAPLDDPRPEAWRDLVPHRPGEMIAQMIVTRDHLVWLEREDALPRLMVRGWQSGDTRALDFDEEAHSLHLTPGYEFETGALRVAYASLTTPDETYDVDLATGGRTLLKRQEIPSGHLPRHYTTRRVFALAPDGERIPISLLHRNDLQRDGRAPLLLEGYGSYGWSSQAEFDENNFSLVDRGFIYAVAHVRGGTERGARWYRDGKREKKPNTFHDFIACAEHLVREDYTGEGRIVAYGASAGGMLMGAVANLAPHLFAGVIAEVPFVDVLHTMLDADLPLTPPEWREWGNPIEDVAAFEAIRGYSPYENVRAQRYPAILALGGLTDPRVTYWEPAKWVWRLRDRMTGGGPIILRTNMEAGHDGASGRFDRLAEIALMHAFAIAAVGAPAEPLGWPDESTEAASP